MRAGVPLCKTLKGAAFGAQLTRVQGWRANLAGGTTAHGSHHGIAVPNHIKADERD
jgi:hypothetical protein